MGAGLRRGGASGPAFPATQKLSSDMVGGVDFVSTCGPQLRSAHSYGIELKVQLVSRMHVRISKSSNDDIPQKLAEQHNGHEPNAEGKEPVCFRLK